MNEVGGNGKFRGRTSEGYRIYGTTAYDEWGEPIYEVDPYDDTHPFSEGWQDEHKLIKDIRFGKHYVCPACVKPIVMGRQLETMNIIFLDIDGVLNCQIFYTNRKKSKSIIEHPQDQICTERVEWLNQLCKDVNAKVVISST